MKNGNIFEYSDFKKYLGDRLSTLGESRGSRLKLSKLMKVKPSYMSKIFSGEIRLSLEHIPIINRFLEHTSQESEYMMYLVLYSQAGSKELEGFFKEKMDTIREKKWAKGEWIDNKKEIPAEFQAKYFSDWYYPVINVLTRVSAYQTKTAIASRLKLSLSTVSTALDFLVQIGLAEIKGDRYRMTKNRIHLDGNSTWISHYHTNMRQLTLRSYTEPNPESLRYSFIMSVSNEDRDKIQALLRRTIVEIDEIVKQTKSEDVCVLAMDLFRV